MSHQQHNVYPHQSQPLYFDDSQSQRSYSQSFCLSQSQSQSHVAPPQQPPIQPPPHSRFDLSAVPSSSSSLFRAPVSNVPALPSNSCNSNVYSQAQATTSRQMTLIPPPTPSSSNSSIANAHAHANNPSTLNRIYASPSREGTPAGGAAGNVGGDNVSSRLLKSLQTLVLLLEKQSAKLDRNDERIQALAEQVEQCKANSDRNCQEIDKLMGQVVAKVDKLTSTTSKTMVKDLTDNMSKELNSIRKETAELKKASKALSETATKDGMSNIVANQERILQAIARERSATQASGSSDLVENITNHQLDILHRLTTQMRSITAAVTSSAQTTNRLVQQNADRHERTQLAEFGRLMSQLSEAVAGLTSTSPSSLPLAQAPSRPTVPDMPLTPPRSQAHRGMDRNARPRLKRPADLFDTRPKEPGLLQCAPAHAIEEAVQDERTKRTLSTPLSPLPRSPAANRPVQPKISRPFPYKRRKISQSDDESPAEDAQTGDLEDLA